MASFVLDASALLAYLAKEPGSDVVLARLLAGNTMTTANFSEVGAVLIRRGGTVDDVRSLRNRIFAMPLTDVDDDLAIRAAALYPASKPAGLSLGDRLCLALAARLGVPAVTADRNWLIVAAAAGVTVELIR